MRGCVGDLGRKFAWVTWVAWSIKFGRGSEMLHGTEILRGFEILACV